MKIIFAGTPQFAVSALTALLKEHEVIAVLTQPKDISIEVLNTWTKTGKKYENN